SAFGAIWSGADPGEDFQSQHVSRFNVPIDKRAQRNRNFFRLVRISRYAGNAAHLTRRDNRAVLEDLSTQVKPGALVIAVLETKPNLRRSRRDLCRLCEWRAKLRLHEFELFE